MGAAGFFGARKTLGQSRMTFSSAHVRDISETQIAPYHVNMLFHRLLKLTGLVLAAAGLSWIAAVAQTTAPPPAAPGNGGSQGKVAVLPVTGETKIHGSTIPSTMTSQEPLGDAARRLRKHKKHRKHVIKAKVRARHQRSAR
jgi:hypothetical protein